MGALDVVLTFETCGHDESIDAVRFSFVRDG